MGREGCETLEKEWKRQTYQKKAHLGYHQDSKERDWEGEKGS